MRARDRILQTLANEGPLCDDCLSVRAKVRPRQAVNQNARSLEGEGRLTRFSDRCPHCRSQKLVNFPENTETLRQTRADDTPLQERQDRPWYWEGTVQAHIVSYLRSQGSDVLSMADTQSRERGKDIVARSSDGKLLWVSVKGYPETSQHVQARHWFAGAIFDLTLYRDEDADVDLAIGLPAGFTTYENLSKRVRWLRCALPFSILWVSEDGAVSDEAPRT